MRAVPSREAADFAGASQARLLGTRFAHRLTSTPLITRLPASVPAATERLPASTIEQSRAPGRGPNDGRSTMRIEPVARALFALVLSLTRRERARPAGHVGAARAGDGRAGGGAAGRHDRDPEPGERHLPPGQHHRRRHLLPVRRGARLLRADRGAHGLQTRQPARRPARGRQDVHHRPAACEVGGLERRARRSRRSRRSST